MGSAIGSANPCPAIPSPSGGGMVLCAYCTMHIPYPYSYILCISMHIYLCISMHIHACISISIYLMHILMHIHAYLSMFSLFLFLCFFPKRVDIRLFSSCPKSYITTLAPCQPPRVLFTRDPAGACWTVLHECFSVFWGESCHVIAGPFPSSAGGIPPDRWNAVH